MTESKEVAVPKAEKPAKIEQNGVTRPGAGTATEKVWLIADQLSAAAGAAAPRADVLKAAEAEGINVSTAATQYGKWTKFYGIKAAPKVAAPKVAKEAKPKKEKKAKATAEAAAPEVVPAEATAV